MSTGTQRFGNTFQSPVHRAKDAGKSSKKVRQRCLNVSVGDRMEMEIDLR